MCGASPSRASPWARSASRCGLPFPFGKEVEYGGGAGSAILNVLWFVFGGVFLALEALLNGVLLCITVIGIPFGLQCFKQAKLALLPFGAVVRGK